MPPVAMPGTTKILGLVAALIAVLIRPDLLLDFAELYPFT
jgi:hypothetical protein